MQRPDTAINAFLDAEPTPSQVAELEAWIKADPAHAREFIHLLQIHQQIGDRLRKQRSGRALRLAEQLAPDDSAAAMALAELARLHEEGLGVQPELPIIPRSLDRSHGPSRRTVVRARLIIASGLAAVIMLGVGLALMVSLFTSTPPHVVQHPNQQPRPVATLTDAEDAAWQADRQSITLRIGDALMSGQRLTLTRGTAELTTNHGAVATLEAPCTIELIDHDNALRLATGKLVGVVETERAKGFLVRTPHMDVTDLGTRFGIDASDEDATEVHVYQGEVEVARQTESGRDAFRERLVVGQALRARGDSGFGGLTLLDADPLRFIDADKTARSYLAASTGRGLILGQADPNWRVVARDGRPITEGGEMHVADRGEGRGSVPAGEASARWIKVSEAIAPPAPAGRVYTCRTAFPSPGNLDPENSDLVLGIVGGRAIDAVRVNGERFVIPDAVRDRKTFHAPYFELVIDHALRSGQNANIIEIDVYDTDTATTLRAAFEVRPADP